MPDPVIPGGDKQPTIQDLDRLDDEAIARTIRERDATDTGERISLDELEARVLSEIPGGDTTTAARVEAP